MSGATATGAASVSTTAGRDLMRRLRAAGATAIRRVPLLGWLCAAVALVNGLAWTLTIPPFQVPDEIAHVSYAQYLAETGKLPAEDPSSEPFSPEERATLSALAFGSVIGQPQNRPPLTPAQTAALRHVERAEYGRVGFNAATASSNPPLYYIVQAATYRLSPSHDLTDRLVLMRLWSPVFAALTVLAVFLFVREVVPGTPWTWTVAGLAAAFAPTFGFMSGGVNSDVLLYSVSALTLLAAARCVRRGLTPWRGAALGVAAAAGLLTKLTFLAFLPGVALTIAVCVARARGIPELRRAALRGAGLAVAIIAGTALIYVGLTHTLWERPEVTTATAESHASSLRERLSFAWQLFLPRLPFMTSLHPGFPLKDVWSHGFVGQFGWLDYGFPEWVYTVAWWTFLSLGTLFVVSVVVRWRSVFVRASEALVYVVFVLGLLGAIATADYSAYLINGNRFLQGRYLLPVLALYGLFVALAVRTLGERWGRIAGGVFVAASIGATVFAQILTLQRYYG